jgi:AcrR family transcriptional regulator
MRSRASCRTLHLPPWNPQTTVDDIASEVGLPRPNVHRYFADRDDLPIELITRHGRALVDRAHKSASRQSSPPDQIVEGVLFTTASLRRPRLQIAAGGRNLWSMSDCSALRNASSVSMASVNPAWRSLMVLTKARGPSGAP